jgi:hypothetical protein
MPADRGPDGLAADCARIIRAHRPPPRPGRPHPRADRPRRRALPVLPLLGAAAPPRRPHPQRPGGAPLPGERRGPTGALVHGHPRSRQRLPTPDLSMTHTATPIRDLFLADVTRDIPPVVYFHEQSPEKLAARSPNTSSPAAGPTVTRTKRRVPDGIHEQYVRLLCGHRRRARQARRPRPAHRWISGFYGSGKSSFAKLLGLALDGAALPDGRSLAEAWLARDTSPQAPELRDAWAAQRARSTRWPSSSTSAASPATASTSTHVAVRLVQERLGYCTPTRSSPTSSSSSSATASGPLREGRPRDPRPPVVRGARTRQARRGGLLAGDVADVPRPLHRPDELVQAAPAPHAAPSRPTTPSRRSATCCVPPARPRRRSSWSSTRSRSTCCQQGPRRPPARLRLALGRGLRGKVWLMALGQQKIDEDADDSFLVWAKDRFPPKLRVHLANTNIRDVVHKRLLHKNPEAEPPARPVRPSTAPTSSCSPTAARPSPPTTSSRSTRCCRGTSTSSCRSPARSAPARPARRATTRRSAACCSSSASCSAPAARRPAGRRAHHPRPGLRGPAHRPRLRVQASMARMLSQCADEATASWSAPPRSSPCSSSSRTT